MSPKHTIKIQGSALSIGHPSTSANPVTFNIVRENPEEWPPGFPHKLKRSSRNKTEIGNGTRSLMTGDVSNVNVCMIMNAPNTRRERSGDKSSAQNFLWPFC